MNLLLFRRGSYPLQLGLIARWSLSWPPTASQQTLEQYSVVLKMGHASQCLAPNPEVDRGDQLRGYYCCRTKSRKFYKYIFYFLLDVAITNAFILMKKHTNKGSKMTIKDFRLELASELIGDYCSRRRRGRTSSSSIRSLPLRHFPVKVNDDSCPTKRKRDNCAQC